ncbi:DUF6318 family protein [Cellulosimicrobium cellulans]|uniref:DUF6318 family protein n=1 Tax=Cellulosimicrobium cellulans TaxID=1710 RepID=UPI0020CFB5D8
MGGCGAGVGQRSPSRARRATRTCGAVTWWTPREASSTGRDGRFRVARRFARFVAFARCRPVRAAPPGSRAGGLVSRTRHAPVGGRPAGTVGSARALRSRRSARRRALALGVVVTAGCLVAACTGGGDPAPSPPVETSAEPSVTEVPEPEPTTTGPPKPERPAAMERDDAEGAAAAAEYFLELYPYVMSTGDTAEWDAMTWAETCGFCTGVKENALEIKSAGDSYVGSETTVEAATAGEVDSLTGGRAVLVDVTQAAHRRVADDGSVVSEGAQVTGRLHIDVVFTNDQWYVVGASEIDS